MSTIPLPTRSPSVQVASKFAATLPPERGCTPLPISSVPLADFHHDGAAGPTGHEELLENGANPVGAPVTHLRDSARVSLAVNPPPTSLGLQTLDLSDSLLVFASLPTRAKLDEEAVAEYAEKMRAGEKFPPVTVFQDASGIRRLSDGFHRVAAARRAGLTTITAKVRRGTRLDALRHGLHANNRHGVRRTNDDKRHAIKVALNECGDVSDRAIADLCGVGNQLVGQVRAELCESHSSTATRLGRDGKRRRVTAKPVPSSTSLIPGMGKQETVEQAPATLSAGDPAGSEFIPGTMPGCDGAEQATKGATASHFTLADGSELPSSVLTEGWIEPGWMLQKLGNTGIHPRAQTPVQPQGHARFQRILIGVADALNRQIGSAPSAEDLHCVENVLNDLRNFTVTHGQYQR